jgi:sterol 3beta-glucosyltransferase
MKITLLTYGSRGDVQPYLALALGLQNAGHTVRLAAPHRFVDIITPYGIQFAPLPGDPEILSAFMNDLRAHPFRAARSFVKYIFSIAGPVVRAAFLACADADLIVHSFFFTTAAHSLAHSLGIPDVSVQVFPMFAPTRAFPMIALPNAPPGAVSYFTHWLANQIYWHGMNFGLRKLHDPSLPGDLNLKLHWPFDASCPIRTPLLLAYSPTILPKPADWTAPHIHVTGYFFLDHSATYQPTQELADFLAAGEPPVCVTFSSMVNSETDRIDQIVRAALAQTGQRGILLTGWGGRKQTQNHPDVLYLEDVPHDWLFPRCITVVHHGGAGTTAAGLRAGIPNIVIPHGIDQLFWGRRNAAIGAGPAPINLGKLSVETLASAITQVKDPELHARVKGIGRLIRAEDGVGEAVRLIEQHTNAYSLLLRGSLDPGPVVK